MTGDMKDQTIAAMRVPMKSNMSTSYFHIIMAPGVTTIIIPLAVGEVAAEVGM